MEKEKNRHKYVNFILFRTLQKEIGRYVMA